MRKWVSKNIGHIIVWTILVLYLVFARNLYNEFFLKNGKPVAQADPKQAQVVDGKYYIDGLDQVRYDGQDLYLLRGWGFNPSYPTAPLQDYKKHIILASGDRWFVFEASIIPRPALNNAMKDLISGFSGDVTHAGFQGHISEDFLPTGSYRIGLMFTPNTSASPEYLFWTNKYLRRTPNQFSLTNDPVETSALEAFFQKVKRRLLPQETTSSGN